MKINTDQIVKAVVDAAIKQARRKNSYDVASEISRIWKPIDKKIQKEMDDYASSL